jgi:hypothetical protein
MYRAKVAMPKIITLKKGMFERSVLVVWSSALAISFGA